MPVRALAAHPSSRRARPSQERFYGISDDRDFMCPAGKFLARATIPGSGKHAMIIFGHYDSKVEVALPRPRSPA